MVSVWSFGFPGACLFRVKPASAGRLCRFNDGRVRHGGRPAMALTDGILTIDRDSSNFTVGC